MNVLTNWFGRMNSNQQLLFIVLRHSDRLQIGNGLFTVYMTLHYDKLAQWYSYTQFICLYQGNRIKLQTMRTSKIIINYIHKAVVIEGESTKILPSRNVKMKKKTNELKEKLNQNQKKWSTIHGIKRMKVKVCTQYSWCDIL